MWTQKEFNLPAKPRGFHLITDEIIKALPELKQIDCGLLHLFIQHTSASLTINENADPTVRQDLESHFNINGARKSAGSETRPVITTSAPKDSASTIGSEPKYAFAEIMSCSIEEIGSPVSITEKSPDSS